MWQTPPKQFQQSMVELLKNAVGQMRLPQINDLLRVLRHVPGTVTQMLAGQIAHDFGQRRFFFGVDEFETVEKYTRNSDPLVKNAMTQEQIRRHAKHGWLVERMNAGDLQTREDVEEVVDDIEEVEDAVSQDLSQFSTAA